MIVVNVKRAWVVVAILALLFAGSISFSTGINPASAQNGEFESFTPELAEQLAEIYQQKQALTPVQQKIDCHILKLVQNVRKQVSAGKTENFQSLSTPLLKIDNSGNIDVKLTVSSQTAGKIEQLEDLGMNIRLILPDYDIVEGSLPYGQVETVAGLDFVTNVRTPGYAIHDTGDVNSEGDTVLRAAEARAAFSVDGSGIKVGAISDGVTHLSDSVASGDLPSSPAVDVLKAGSGDEGTAMLEIIHDLAPGAALAFYGPDSSSDMVAGIGALETAGCNIIVDDLTYFDEPKFEDGPIALEARRCVNDGGVYACSAGNSAQRHYGATYSRDGQVKVTIGGEDYYYYAHDYGGGDKGNTFDVPNGGKITTILQWNNQWGLAGDDFDLFLITGSTILDFDWNIQNGAGDPWEGIQWTNDTGSSVTVWIAVFEWALVNPPDSLVLDYVVYNNFNPTLEYSMSDNSVIGHAAVEEVLSTAAAAAATPSAIESFSSRGPGTVYFPAYEDRQVPNITGVDGVQTKTGQLGYFSNPFYGTSASAPHVAAIAALVWETTPTLTSTGVFNAITSTAVDLGPAGYDYTWGFGRVDAYEAVSSVAMPDLVVSEKYEEWVNFEAKSYNITYTVKNQGKLSAGASRTGVYIDAAGPWNYYDCPALGPGVSSSKTVGTFIMSGNSDSILVYADIPQEIDESDADNNFLRNDWGETLITGITYEVNCAILPGVAVELFDSGQSFVDSDTSSGSGSYNLTAYMGLTYTMEASKDGFREETQQVVVRTDQDTFDFRGNTGLIPNSPGTPYLVTCIHYWLHPELGCELGTPKLVSVIHAWLHPV